jgi:hypothetical protein
MTTSQTEDGIVLWVGAIPNYFPTLDAALEAVYNSLMLSLDPKVPGRN